MCNYAFSVPEFWIILSGLFGIACVRRSKWLIGLVCGASLFLLYFFRDWTPPCIPRDPHALYCPCEGEIREVVQDGHRVRIAVFLNLHNIHVQYMPCDARVVSIEHRGGTFVPVFFWEKSRYNERQVYTLSNEFWGTVVVTQIAGQVARRTRSFVRMGDFCPAWAPLGMIQLGSRVDIEFEGVPLVRVGQKVNVGDVLSHKGMFI